MFENLENQCNQLKKFLPFLNEINQKTFLYNDLKINSFLDNDILNQEINLLSMIGVLPTESIEDIFYDKKLFEYLNDNIYKTYEIYLNNVHFNLHHLTFDKIEDNFNQLNELLYPQKYYYKTNGLNIIDCLYKIEGFRNSEKRLIYIGSTNTAIKRMKEHFDIYKNNGKNTREKSIYFHKMEQMTNCDSFKITFYHLKNICDKNSFVDDNLKLYAHLIDDIYLNFNENLLTEKTIKENLKEKLVIISGGSLASKGKNILIDND